MPRTSSSRETTRGRGKSIAGKRHPLNMRTTKETRDRLAAAAAASGRSLVQEVEFRVEQTFRQEDARVQFFGGPELDALFKQIAGAVGFIEQKTGAKWTEDYETYIAVTAALDRIVKEVRSTMQPTPSARTVAMVAEAIEMKPRRPDVPRPTPAELLGQPAERPGYIVGTLLGGAVPPTEPKFASADDAKRSEEEWVEYDRQMEGYRQRLQDTKAYFDALTQIGDEAATQRRPNQTPRED
jgi:hypothetical protein